MRCLVVRYLKKLLMDPEAGIRVNTIVCLGRIAKHFDFAKLREVSDHMQALLPASPVCSSTAPPTAFHDCDLALDSPQSASCSCPVSQNVFPCFLRAMKDPFPKVRVAAVKSITHTMDLIPANVRASCCLLSLTLVTSCVMP